MPTNAPKGRQVAGTEALPITLAAAPGPLAVWTLTHNKGMKALKVEVLQASSHQEIAATVMAVAQPSVNQMTVTNLSGAPVSAIVLITWVLASGEQIASVAASAGVIS